MILRSALFLLMLSKLAMADGGTVLFHRTAGDFDITVFSKSEAAHAGINDFSVMVQGHDNNTVMEATVLVRLKQLQSDGQIMRLTGIATHKKATNKMLYGTAVNIPSTGRWQLEAEVISGGKSALATGEVNVLPPQSPMENYWPFVAMVPLLGIAFIINRKLREKFRARSH